MGDILLFNRFIPAIKERWPSYDLYAYLDTNNNPAQAEILKYLYGNWYKSIETITHKKYKNFIINSEWGEESDMIGFQENIPDEWTEKINSHEVVINGHLDSLDFIEQTQYNWSKYFRVFPRPNIKCNNFIGDYICCNIYSSSSNQHRLENFYITRLIKDLDKLCAELNYKNIIISQESSNHLYDEALRDCKNTHVLNSDIEGVCDMISNSKLMVACDTGFRPVAWGFDIPVVTLSKECMSPGQISPPQLIRWNPQDNLCFPLNWNTSDIVSLTKRILENKVYQILPNLIDWRKQLIKRDYKVNTEKSILNERQI